MRMKECQLSKFAACMRIEDEKEEKEEKGCHLLKLLHNGLVEHEADDEGDAHDQEEDGADDVHHQVHREVAHLENL